MPPLTAGIALDFVKSEVSKWDSDGYVFSIVPDGGTSEELKFRTAWSKPLRTRPCPQAIAHVEVKVTKERGELKAVCRIENERQWYDSGRLQKIAGTLLGRVIKTKMEILEYVDVVEPFDKERTPKEYLEERDLEAEAEAALRIQSINRARIARSRVQELREERSATKVQTMLRAKAARERVHVLRQHKSAEKVQAIIRGRQARQQVAIRRRLVVILDTVPEAHKHAESVQRAMRGRLARKRVEGIKRERSAVQIQRIMRGRSGRIDIVKRQASATKVQSAIRARVARKRVHRIREDRSATKVQSVARARAARRRVDEVRTSKK